MTSLHADHRRDLSFVMNPENVVGCPGELEIRIPIDEFVDNVEFSNRVMEGGCRVGRRKDRPELCTDLAFPKAWNVGRKLRLPNAQIDEVQVPIHRFKQRRRQIIVPINQRYLAEQFSGTGKQLRLRFRPPFLCRRTGRKHENCDYDQHDYTHGSSHIR